MWPAIWSATAASLSAITAYLTFRIHSTNSRETIRPELVVKGWERTGTTESPEEIHLGPIKNIGRGAAFNIWTKCLGRHEGIVTASMVPISLPVLAANDEHELSESIRINWRSIRNASELEDQCSVPLTLTYSDSRGCWYVTTYHLFIHESQSYEIVGVTTAAPGLFILHRDTRCVTGLLTPFKDWWTQFRWVYGRKLKTPAFRDVE